MGLSTEEAMIFANNKVAEHRAQKKAANKRVHTDFHSAVAP